MMSQNHSCKCASPEWHPSVWEGSIVKGSCLSLARVMVQCWEELFFCSCQRPILHFCEEGICTGVYVPAMLCVAPYPVSNCLMRRVSLVSSWKDGRSGRESFVEAFCPEAGVDTYVPFTSVFFHHAGLHCQMDVRRAQMISPICC